MMKYKNKIPEKSPSMHEPATNWIGESKLGGGETRLEDSWAWKDEATRKKLQKGLADSEAGRVTYIGSFSQYLNDK